jgi:hypothetical protein
LPLHAADDGEFPAVAILDRDDFAELGRRVSRAIMRQPLSLRLTIFTANRGSAVIG